MMKKLVFGVIALGLVLGFLLASPRSQADTPAVSPTSTLNISSTSEVHARYFSYTTNETLPTKDFHYSIMHITPEQWGSWLEESRNAPSAVVHDQAYTKYSSTGQTSLLPYI